MELDVFFADNVVLQSAVEDFDPVEVGLAAFNNVGFGVVDLGVFDVDEHFEGVEVEFEDSDEAEHVAAVDFDHFAGEGDVEEGERKEVDEVEVEEAGGVGVNFVEAYKDRFGLEHSGAGVTFVDFELVADVAVEDVAVV